MCSVSVFFCLIGCMASMSSWCGNVVDGGQVHCFGDHDWYENGCLCMHLVDTAMYLNYAEMSSNL